MGGQQRGVIFVHAAFGSAEQQQARHQATAVGAGLLRCGIGEHAERPPARRRSDRMGEFGERRGHPRGGWYVQAQFVVTTSLGVTFSVRTARAKKRRAALASRCADSSTSMTWPCWSTAR